MAVRIATIGVPRFMDGGLEVGKGWREVAELNERQRAVLRDRHGRLIQVHPEDRAKLREFGLEFEALDKPLVDLKKPDAGGKTDAKKTDATGAGNTQDPKPDAGGKTDAKKTDATRVVK